MSAEQLGRAAGLSGPSEPPNSDHARVGNRIAGLLDGRIRTEHNPISGAPHADVSKIDGVRLSVVKAALRTPAVWAGLPDAFPTPESELDRLGRAVLMALDEHDDGDTTRHPRWCGRFVRVPEGTAWRCTCRPDHPAELVAP